MKRYFAITTGLMLLLSVAAFGQLRLVPMKYSQIKLINGKKSVVVDLEDALTGTNGTLPGNPPHKYRVLFRTQKDDFLYLVANVQSRSPISDPMAPCGGDSPQSILWIKADKTLKTREFDSQIYASCSYNYYDSKVRLGKTRLKVKYGGEPEAWSFKIIEMSYDNRKPEWGLMRVFRNVIP